MVWNLSGPLLKKLIVLEICLVHKFYSYVGSSVLTSDCSNLSSSPLGIIVAFPLIGSDQPHIIGTQLPSAYLGSFVLPPLLRFFASTITMTVTAVVMLRINTTATIPRIFPAVLSVSEQLQELELVLSSAHV